MRITQNINLTRALVGGAIVLLGLLLTLDQLGLPVDSVLERFPAVFLVALGVVIMAKARRDAIRLLGGLVIALGVFILLGLIGVFWPLLLLLGGGAILWTAFGRPALPVGSRVSAEDADVLRDFVIFGGSERRSTSRNLRGGELTAIFGSLEMDLRDSVLPPEGAVFEVTVIFGGIEIRVPEGWNVVQEASVIFGGFEDGTRARDVEAAPAGGPPRLIVRGFALFGGVEIKN